MRRLLKKILDILDGTPAEYGQRSRGQSVVELALVTPILIVLLMGLAEVGWFANNYIILLEVTRTGARTGTVQTGATSPLAWDNKYSIAPDISGDDATKLDREYVRDCDLVNSPNNSQLRGFYSVIHCVMLTSLDPLEFHGDDEDPPTGRVFPDDIVISAFSLQLIDPSKVPAKLKSTLVKVDGIADDMPRVLVVGRYPTNANECTRGGSSMDYLDPFDFFKNGKWDYDLIKASEPDTAENRLLYELPGYDPDSYAPFGSEPQRGYAVLAQHSVRGKDADTCFGSSWSIQDIEHWMNLPNYSLTAKVERDRLASMGLVLVEMFWQHELLLKNPVFNPVFTILGERTTISVWAAFPVPAIEPRLRFE